MSVGLSICCKAPLNLLLGMGVRRDQEMTPNDIEAVRSKIKMTFYMKKLLRFIAREFLDLLSSVRLFMTRT